MLWNLQVDGVFTSPSALKTTKTKKQLEIWHPNSHKTNPYIIRCFFCWPKFSEKQKINCPINPSFISSHISYLTFTLQPYGVLLAIFQPPLRVPGSPTPWLKIHTPSSPCQVSHTLNFKMSISVTGLPNRGRWMDLCPLDPWEGPWDFRRFSFDGRFWGWKNLSPNTNSIFFETSLKAKKI